MKSIPDFDRMMKEKRNPIKDDPALKRGLTWGCKFFNCKLTELIRSCLSGMNCYICLSLN